MFFPFLIAGAACTIVVHHDGSGIEAKPLRAHVLLAVSVDGSAASLAPELEEMVFELGTALSLQQPQVLVEKLAVVPLDHQRGAFPELIFARDIRFPLVDDVPDGPSPEPGGVGDSKQGLGSDLRPEPGDWSGGSEGLAMSIVRAAGDPSFKRLENVAEHHVLAALGPVLGDALELNPQIPLGELRPFFDETPDLLLVATVQHLRRDCAFGEPACDLEHGSPDVHFSRLRQDGTLDWIRYSGGQGLYPQQVIHLSLVTAEEMGEEQFYSSCLGLPGFPPNLADSIEPSSKAYYGPFSDGLSARIPGRALWLELCPLLSSSRQLNLLQLAKAISRAGSELN